MAEVLVKHTYNAPVEKVFGCLNEEYGDIYKYNPNLKYSYIIDDSPLSGKGAIRQCNMLDGKNWIKEKIIDIKQNEQMVLDIYDGTMPLEEAEVIVNFRKVSASKSEVTLILRFRPKMKILGALMTPLMKKQFRPLLKSFLKASADYVENGTQANATKQAA